MCVYVCVCMCVCVCVCALRAEASSQDLTRQLHEAIADKDYKENRLVDLGHTLETLRSSLTQRERERERERERDSLTNPSVANTLLPGHGQKASHEALQV